MIFHESRGKTRGRNNNGHCRNSFVEQRIHGLPRLRPVSTYHMTRPSALVLVSVIYIYTTPIAWITLLWRSHDGFPLLTTFPSCCDELGTNMCTEAVAKDSAPNPMRHNFTWSSLTLFDKSLDTSGLNHQHHNNSRKNSQNSPPADPFSLRGCWTVKVMFLSASPRACLSKKILCDSCSHLLHAKLFTAYFVVPQVSS